MKLYGKYFLALSLLLWADFVIGQSGIINGRQRMQSLFMYNFASKYIEWPAPYNEGNFIFGIFGDSPVLTELETVTASKKVYNQPIEIKKFNSVDEITKCNFLFIPFEKSDLINEISEKLRNTGTLIITENTGALNHGAGINFVEIYGKLKFETNLDIIARKGITIAPDLLKLSINTIPPSGTAGKITTFESGKISEIKEKATEKDWEKLYTEMEKQLKMEQQTINLQKVELTLTKDTVNILGKENERKQTLLIEKGMLLSKKEKEIEEQIITLRQLKDEIKSRENLIEINKNQISQQDKILNKQIEDINKQQFIIYSTATMFVLALGFVFFVVRANNQRQKAFRIISMQKVEVEKAKRIIEEKNQDIIASIRYAQRIQETILPTTKIVKQYLENSFILFKPRDIVSGDFYWMETVGEKVLFAVVDCTGHGVPGAFVSIVGHNGLNRAVKEFGLSEPAKILDKLNEIVEEHFSKSEADIKDGMDISLCGLDLKNSIIEFSAANNSGYFIRNGELSEIKANKQPIGKYMKRTPFTNHTIELVKGDSIYLFSDGYADQFGGPKRKKFKYSKFKEVLLSIQSKSMDEQREILHETIDKWRGELEQIDDICIIGVRI